MTRGNQRELARQKNQKKQQNKGAGDHKGNKGKNLTERKERDAEVMRLKQQKAAEKKSQEGPK